MNHVIGKLKILCKAANYSILEIYIISLGIFKLF